MCFIWTSKPLCSGLLEQPHSLAHATLTPRTSMDMRLALRLAVVVVLTVRGSNAQTMAPTYKSPSKAEELGRAYTALISSLTPKRLKRLALERRDQLLKAEPVPHLVLDGLFPPALLNLIQAEHPENVLSNGCTSGATKCFKGRSTGVKNKDVQHLKSVVDSEARMGPALRLMFAFLKSSVWVTFLERLTSTVDLIPDPHYRGSGLHLTSSGGRLAIHADFNRYQRYDLRRRVNTFIFLNDDWPDEHGGHLELWNRELTQCKQRVLPSLGRFVVFQTTDFSYHGHPQPLAAPRHRVRRSIALYYFTNGCPAEQCINRDCSTSHSTLWQKGACAVCARGNACAAFSTVDRQSNVSIVAYDGSA